VTHPLLMIGRFSFNGFVASIIVSSWLLFAPPPPKKESHMIENPKLQTSSSLDEEENELRHCSQLKSSNQRISHLIKRLFL
jgi:hypothetical protein